MPARRAQATPSPLRRRRQADVATRLHSAAIHLLRRLRAEDAGTGLAAPALSALSVIVFGGPVTVGQLARAEQVRPATISRLVRELERRGLVRRERDTGDRRVQRLQATATGRRMLEQGRARRVAALERDLGPLTPSELDALERGVRLLERMLEPHRGNRKRANR